MMSVFRLGVLGATTAFFLVAGATGAFAASDDPIAPTEEFPHEAAVLVAATAKLFDDIEQDLAETREKPGKLQIRIIGKPTQATAKPDSKFADIFPPENGPVDHLTGYRITWYPMDRLVGIVDFMGAYDGNRNLVCGYVSWDLTDPDLPKLERVSANYVDLQLLAQRHPGATHAALLDANCAFGEIEPNFAYFDVGG